jgi:hypothetical protein
LSPFTALVVKLFSISLLNLYFIPLKIFFSEEHWWLMPVILATQETEIRRTMFAASPGK